MTPFSAPTRCAGRDKQEGGASPPLTFRRAAQATGPLLRPLGCCASRWRATALRAALDPGDLGGPWEQEERAGPGLPRPGARRASSAVAGGCGTRKPGNKVNWRSINRRRRKITQWGIHLTGATQISDAPGQPGRRAFSLRDQRERRPQRWGTPVKWIAQITQIQAWAPGPVTSSQQSHLAKLRHTEPGVHETRDAPPSRRRWPADIFPFITLEGTPRLLQVPHPQLRLMPRRAALQCRT